MHLGSASFDTNYYYSYSQDTICPSQIGSTYRTNPQIPDYISGVPCFVAAFDKLTPVQSHSEWAGLVA